MKVSNEPSYQASFTWKNNKIYDGKKQIASFTAESYMGPILHEVVLKPGGKPLINWAIGWRAPMVTSTHIVDKISVKGKGSPRLEMEFISHTPSKYFSSKVQIVLTYEEKLKSYLYLTEGSLTVDKFPFANWRDFDEKGGTQWTLAVPLEFANVFPLSETMWQAWIYKDVKGNWVKIPLQHLFLPGLYDIRFNHKQGILGLFDAPEGNVMIELLDNSATNSKKGSLCWAAYDMHFMCKLISYSRKYWTKYRLFQYDCEDKHSRDMVSQAQCQTYSPEQLEVYQLPRFSHKRVSDATNGIISGVSDFTKGIDINTNDQGVFWVPFGDISYTKWLKEGGYKKGGHLRTESKIPVSTSWQLYDAFTHKKYLFSAYVKTKQLEGEGAYLSCKSKSGENQYDSPKLTGDHDWTKIQLIIFAPSGTGRYHHQSLILQHKGRGYSAFSRVEFREYQEKGK